MKHLILFILLTFAAIRANAQTKLKLQMVDYEAANWKTILLSNPQQIKITAPPSAAETKAEIRDLKKRTANLDSKKLAAIKYWDAGAPSYRWNQIAPTLTSYEHIDIILRSPASWMNLAIYDATILAWKEKLKYKRQRPQILDKSITAPINAPKTYSYPCEHAVTAAAAANVLAYFYPEKADSILKMAHAASQSRIDAGVQYASDVEAGWNLGEQVARQIIAAAKNDGSANFKPIKTNTDQKKWTGSFALGSTTGQLKPIILKAGDQFRPVPPPDFAPEMKELKDFKPDFRSTSLAYKWDNQGGEYWVELTSNKLFEYRLSDNTPAAAKIYAVLATATHDAVIAIMDAKYAYWGIRPNQYDSNYKPILNTPPFPGYPSGHALGSSVASTILSYFFPADAKQFQQLAQDCADSRFYGGIHFKTDNETGLQMGKKIGNYVVETWMEK